MVKNIRQQYNEFFSEEKYASFLKEMNDQFSYEIDFRISESPVFIDKDLKKAIMQAGEEIVDVIVRPDFKAQSEKAVPDQLRVPGEDAHTSLLAIDFAICDDGNGGYIPQLIEMQGFASLYCWQEYLSMQYQKHFLVPANYDNKFNGFSHERYLAALKKVIVADEKPEHVILLEIEPWKQKTQIDFRLTQDWLGIRAICLSEVIKEGRSLFYLRDGVKTPIKRIYNRIIFDELLQREDLPRQFNLTDDVDVKWIAHPNWFFRISKYTMPFLKSRFVPETHFVSDLKFIPNDLENWVLKPLFSFSGQGVIFDVEAKHFEGLDDASNYILQRKVSYAGAVESPTDPVKTEIRLLYLWPEGDARPTLMLNLGRMSKGKMIGVRYNADLDWVGGTTFFMEKE